MQRKSKNKNGKATEDDKIKKWLSSYKINFQDSAWYLEKVNTKKSGDYNWLDLSRNVMLYENAESTILGRNYLFDLALLGKKYKEASCVSNAAIYSLLYLTVKVGEEYFTIEECKERDFENIDQTRKLFIAGESEKLKKMGLDISKKQKQKESSDKAQ